eukprot:scaffold26806_cov27-Tisochrysis_lutea.AAC.1
MACVFASNGRGKESSAVLLLGLPSCEELMADVTTVVNSSKVRSLSRVWPCAMSATSIASGVKPSTDKAIMIFCPRNFAVLSSSRVAKTSTSVACCRWVSVAGRGHPFLLSSREEQTSMRPSTSLRPSSTVASPNPIEQGDLRLEPFAHVQTLKLLLVGPALGPRQSRAPWQHSVVARRGAW